jgi:hypothetical protein
MLGDAIVYGCSACTSLLELPYGKLARRCSRASSWPSSGMAVFGVGIVAEVVAKLVRGLRPEAEIMWAVPLVALIANASVLALLWRHRADDINMRPVWLCSRNDVIAKGGFCWRRSG